ncbi:hypothetical protein RIF29_31542 [Crotalaria pallida]|uniref:Cysteine-rich receptor-like protein kinase 10 n=1 Tax=Crotalaria pallida TaxID=3830 RepID=A0AAN9HVB8_CROPI
MDNGMLCFSSSRNVNVSDLNLFSQRVQDFLGQVSEEVVLNPRMYASGKSEIGDFHTAYGFAQCSRDLSHVDCKKCLNQSVAFLPLPHCGGEGKEGAGVYNEICRVRYELSPFLNGNPIPLEPSTFDAISPQPQPENSSHCLDAAVVLFYPYTNAQGDPPVGPLCYCNNATNYTHSKPYEQNLNVTLSSLVSNVSLNGFSNVTVGQNPYVVYGLLQCRGDVSYQFCEVCAKTAANKIRQLCPNQEEATLVDLNCTLKYSNQPLSSVTDSDRMLVLINVQNASNPSAFDQQLTSLLQNLASNAASSSSKLAAGSTAYTNIQNIYAMAQCIRGSTESSCLSCLQLMISQIPFCCAGSVGGRIISTGCNLRYEIYSFVVSLPPPASAPSPHLPASAPSPQLPDLTSNGTSTNSTSPSGNKNTGKKTIIVVIPVAVASILIFAIYQSKKSLLEWERRYKIIVGIARGLLYLHEDSQLRVIHRDLKASNILLDENMNPKISDFGLARLFHGSQTQANTNRIAGTYGYMAPEYIKSGNFSVKSDVYSFGILVLELLAGEKNSHFRNLTNIQSYAWHQWSNGTALEIMDPALGNQWPKHEALKCIHIGLLCVQDAANDRPTMSEIVTMLNSYTVTFPAATRPAFFVPKGEGLSDLTMENQGGSQFDQSVSGVPQQSMNDVTISELDPR